MKAIKRLVFFPKNSSSSPESNVEELLEDVCGFFVNNKGVNCLSVTLGEFQDRSCFQLIIFKLVMKQKNKFINVKKNSNSLIFSRS